jgi:DNA-binding response OmpR family regulator
VIAFVSKSEADCRTLRQVTGVLSQAVASCADVQQARMVIRLNAPNIVLCEAQVRGIGNWEELLEEARAADSLLLVVSRQADERLWAEVLNLGRLDVLALPFQSDELKRVLSSALRHSPRASVAAAAI